MLVKPLKPRPLGVLLAYDLRVSLSSPRGLLFLAFYAMVWGWAISKLAGGVAEQLRGEQASTVMALFLNTTLLRLFQEQPPTLSVFFIVALTLTPWFAMLGACDQTAGDLATKHLRFLIPRAGRNEIYFARFLGAAILVGGAQLLAAIAATIVQLEVGGTPAVQVLAFGAQVALVLTVYSIAYVALMSLVCATMASVRLSLLSGLGAYFVIVVAAAGLSMKWSGASVLAYLVPSGLKMRLLQPDLGGAALALGGVLLYIGVYLFAGLRIFRVRDA